MWLVTGATGHIGNVLVRELLERGEKVRALIVPNECRASLDGLDVESYILSGQRISVRYLLETIREITGKYFFKMKIPLDLAKFAALFTPMYYSLAKATPRFTPYSLEVLRSNSNISHAKATHELDYQPRPLYESIRDAVKWFLEKK